MDPVRADHYLFDGGSVPLRRDTVMVEFGNGPGMGMEMRETWSSPLGSVIHRGKAGSTSTAPRGRTSSARASSS